jgi:hypothetical protein
MSNPKRTRKEIREAIKKIKIKRELNNKNIDAEEITALNFLHKYADNELTNAESIRRMRAKLQEEELGLRGEAYKIRKGKLQEEWRKNLGYENN